MKREIKSVLSLALSALVLTSFVACSGGAGNSSDSTAAATQSVTSGNPDSQSAAVKEPSEPTTIVFSALDCIGGEEKKKAQDEWTITKLIRKFEQANPGVTVEIQIPADASTAHATFKAASLAGNGPDVANLWSGQNIFMLKDALLQLDDLIPDEDKPLFENASAVHEGLKPDGKIWAYPFISKNYGFFLYNKEIIKNAGLDFEANPPKTIAELEDAMTKIKALGVIPFYEDNIDCQLFFYGVGLWWQQLQDPEKLMAEGEGKLKIADDPGFIKAFTTYQELYSKGLINTNVASAKDRYQQFYNGKAAIVAGGSWSIVDGVAAMGDKFGIMHFPDISEDARIKDTSVGGIGETLVASKRTEHPDLAVKLMSFLNSRDSELELLKVLGGAPIRKDITLEDLGWQNDPIFTKLYGWGQKDVFPFPPAVIGTNAVNTISNMTVKVLTGKMTPAELAELTDKVIAEANK